MTDNVLRILFIDDEKAICRNFLDFLEDCSEFHAYSYLNAEDAIASLSETECPDICIVDMRLPGLHGDEFIHIAKGICPDCHFIVCTGSIDMELTPSLSEIGLTEKDIFYKPVEMIKIINRIKEVAG